VSNDIYGLGKIPINYSESYDADEDDVGDMRSSEADSETTFGYSTRETVQKDGEDMTKDISDSGKIAKKYSNMDKEREATFDENTLQMVKNHAETKRKVVLEHGKMAKNYSEHENGVKPTFSKHQSQSAKKMAKGKHKLIAKVVDLISVPHEIFDYEPGSYSSQHPERCYGIVSSIDKKGIAKVIWVEDGSINGLQAQGLNGS
jgi:hypothetical protein